jgi:hypothetical protein
VVEKIASGLLKTRERVSTCCSQSSNDEHPPENCQQARTALVDKPIGVIEFVSCLIGHNQRARGALGASFCIIIS